MRHFRFFPLILALSALATSCATFPSNELTKLPAQPVQASKKVSLSYQMAGSTELLQGKPADMSAKQKGNAEMTFLSAAQNSGRFSSVSAVGKGDVKVNFHLLNHGNAALAMTSGFISGYTLMIVPGFGTDQYKLTASVRTSSGKSRNYELNDSATTVFWLPFIVVTPFKSPSTVIPKVHENMYRTLFSRMEADGLLPKSSN
jgi:hypothetical protein